MAGRVAASVRELAARRIALIGLTAIVVFALVLRCWRLGDRGLWFDEAFSWRLSSFGWRELIARSALDNHPPLYFLLLKSWIACFGASALAMRSLSVLAGAMACIGMYLFIREAYDFDSASGSLSSRQVSSTGVLAAGLVATSVLQLRWSWEIRMYSLGALLATLSSWLLLRALNASERPLAHWLAYSGSVLAFAYTHTFALFSLAAQALYGAGYLTLAIRQPSSAAGRLPLSVHRQPTAAMLSPHAGPGFPGNLTQATRRWIAPCLALLLIAVGYSPWLPVLIRQHRQVRDNFWIEPLTCASAQAAASQMFVDPTNDAGNHNGWIYALACAGLVTVLVIRPVPTDALLCLSAVVPVGLAAVISVWDAPIFYGRYFVFAQLFFLAALARLVCRVPGLPERWIVAVVVVGNFLLIDYDFFQRLSAKQSGGLQAAAQSVASRRIRGEPVIVCSPYCYLPLRYALADDSDCRLLDPGRSLPHFAGIAALTRTDFISLTEAAGSDGRRLWVLDGGRHATICTLPPSRWRRVTTEPFVEEYAMPVRLTVIQYERIQTNRF